MQNWKYPCVFVFIYKKYPENFGFLILRILELFAREVYAFFKKYVSVCKQTLRISHLRKLQKVDVLMWNFQDIIFIWRQKYLQIFKSALVYLNVIGVAIVQTGSIQICYFLMWNWLSEPPMVSNTFSQMLFTHTHTSKGSKINKCQELETIHA